MKAWQIGLLGAGALGVAAAVAGGAGPVPVPPIGTIDEDRAIAQALEQGGTVGEMTNAAYWDAYPQCPQKLDADDPSHADCITAWKRLQARVEAATGTEAGWKQEIRSIVAPVIAETGWIGLDDYFIWVAKGESGGKAGACNVTEHGTCAPNSARGWLQLRPNSAFAFQLEHLRSQPDLLLDKRTNIAMGVWYAYRLRKHGFSGQVIDRWALRRGWALPSLVSDVDFDRPRSKETYGRAEPVLAKVGLSNEWAFSPAFPPGFTWPGLNRILQLTGASAIA